MLKKFGWILFVIFLFSTLCIGAATVSKSPVKATKTSVKATQSPTATPTITLNNQKEKLSYSLGIDIAKSFKTQEIEVDLNLLIKGLTDGLLGAKPLLTEEEINAVFATLQTDMTTKTAERQAKLGVQNQKDGDAFLEANKTKEGVITLPSGLQYKELAAGNGASPVTEDTVSVNYRCTLLDGTEVDSSYKRGEPSKFPVSGIIAGWSEALKLMKVGAKWQLFVPANLAYGPNGAGSVIGPNMTLIFEVELIGIEPKQ